MREVHLTGIAAFQQGLEAPRQRHPLQDAHAFLQLSWLSK